MSTPSSPTMQIDLPSVKLTWLTFALPLLSYGLYTAILRPTRPTLQRLLGELVALWLSFDALTHGVVVAMDMARSLPLSSSSPATAASTQITLIWQTLAHAQPTMRPQEVVGQLAVSLAGPVAGFAALRWWREGERWREGEMLAATMDIYATILGFVQFRPEPLREMSREKRAAAMGTWMAFFWLNMLWLVIPGALLWYNGNALLLDRAQEGEVREREIPQPASGEKSIT